MFPLRSSLTWVYLQTFRLGLVGNRYVQGGGPFGSPIQGCQNRQSMAACTEVLLGAAP